MGFYFGTRSGEEGGADPGTSGIVRGIVRSGTNPARGAVVKFQRTSDGSQLYSRISDIDGRFDVVGVKPDKYTVSAATGGSASDALPISVSEGSDQEILLEIKATTTTTTSR